MAADDPLRLLMQIKGDLGETHGLVTAVRSDLADNRQEDITRLDRIDGRLGTIERQQAEAAGHARALEFTWAASAEAHMASYERAAAQGRE